jgi:hypothetical protein
MQHADDAICLASQLLCRLVLKAFIGPIAPACCLIMMILMGYYMNKNPGVPEKMKVG